MCVPLNNWDYFSSIHKFLFYLTLVSCNSTVWDFVFSLTTQIQVYRIFFLMDNLDSSLRLQNFVPIKQFRFKSLRIFSFWTIYRQIKVCRTFSYPMNSLNCCLQDFVPFNNQDLSLYQDIASQLRLLMVISAIVCTCIDEIEHKGKIQ